MRTESGGTEVASGDQRQSPGGRSGDLQIKLQTAVYRVKGCAKGFVRTQQTFHVRHWGCHTWYSGLSIAGVFLFAASNVTVDCTVVIPVYIQSSCYWLYNSLRAL